MSERPTIARVEPLTTTRAVKGPFDYRLPGGEGPKIGVGSLLVIPFGGRLVHGVVTELAARSELADERLVGPERVLPLSVPPDLVALARWLAREYCSTFARALALMLAPGATTGAAPRRVLVAELTETGTVAVHTGGSGHGTTLSAGQREILGALHTTGATVAAELGTPTLRRLEARGLVRIQAREMMRGPRRHVVSASSAHAPALTEDQRHVLEPILQAIGAGRTHEDGAALLLHGVTGSGKTEVYLAAVAATLAAGRTAIVLVPEISLTPQALARFSARLGEVVAVMHSGLSRGARHDEWLRMRRGEARVCVGPRSAVFAPLSELGLIIVDEEHEGSYKNEGDPRYDARRVAAQRAAAHGAVLLAGSATPRPESVQELRRLRLPHRVDSHPLPPVELLDMRGCHHPLHPVARMALADLRHAGGKGILLLNRRGWSNFLSCRSCGRVWMCPNCEVALVLHRTDDGMSCHHCGHREPRPSRCPDCTSVAVARHGAGTERIERELAEALGAPEFPVLRLDADSSGIDARAGTLSAFAAAPAGVLIGTQMVAKGHDFPDVGLGIVLDADGTLRFPDFRAEERTFALVTQLAGRAGRGSDGARVLVQTSAPEARSLRFASRHDSDGFLTGELRYRELLGYPPFASLIRVVCSARGPAEVGRTAAELRALIPAGSGVVLGPAPLFRLRGRDRAQIVIKAVDRVGAIEAVGAAVDSLARAAGRAGVSLSVDVDPQ